MLLARLEAALRLHYPKLAEALQPGADAAEMARLEALAEEPLPQDFTALYSWHAGSSREDLFLGFRLLSVKEVEETWHQLRQAVPDTTRFHPKWLPFLWDGEDAWYCLDLEGVYDCTDGQVVLYEHGDRAWVAFDSVRRLIRTLEEAAQAHILLPGENDEALEKLCRRLNPGFPHRGDAPVQALKQKMEVERKNLGRVLILSAHAVLLAPRDTWLWTRRYQALLALKQWPEALEALDRLLECVDDSERPRWQQVRNQLAQDMERLPPRARTRKVEP